MKKILIVSLLFFSYLTYSQKKWSLEDCLDYAIVNNIQINQLRVNSNIQNQNVKATKGSLLPTVFSGATYQNFSLGNSSIQFNNFRSSFNIIDAEWTVFNGLKNRNNFKKSQIDNEIADKNIQILFNDIALIIADNYLQVLLNKELLNVADKQLELSKRQLAISKELLKSGIITEASVFEVEATVATDEQTLVQRENIVLSSLLFLKQQVQLPAPYDGFDVSDIDPDKFLITLEVRKPDRVYEDGEKNRPEISAAALNIESAEKNIFIAAGNYLPSLTLGYGYGSTFSFLKGAQNENFSTQFSDNISSSITANLKIPIFTGMSNKTNLEIAKLNKLNAEYDEANEKYVLRQNIETAYLDATNAKKVYEASLKTLESRKISLDFTERRFKTGTVNSFDFENSKNNYISSLSNVAQTKYDYIFRVKVLQFFAGNDFTLNN